MALSSSVTAQTFSTIKSFGSLTKITGRNPESTLVQGLDGTLYGTATYGFGSDYGTVFKVQPDGTGYTVLKWFTNANATPASPCKLPQTLVRPRSGRPFPAHR
jgi:uncharacterized repeat protein (TIGR03803 family)